MIGLDLDGVVINFQEVFREEILKRFNFDVEKDTNYQFEVNVPGVEDHALWESITDIILTRGASMQPYPGAIEAIHSLNKKTGVIPTFVTARTPAVGHITDAWLRKYLKGPFWLFHIRSSMKAEWLAEQGFSHFVDDRFRTAREVADRLDGSMLMNRPWNSERYTPPNVTRVNDLGEAVALYLGGTETWQRKRS